MMRSKDIFVIIAVAAEFAEKMVGADREALWPLI